MMYLDQNGELTKEGRFRQQYRPDLVSKKERKTSPFQYFSSLFSFQQNVIQDYYLYILHQNNKQENQQLLELVNDYNKALQKLADKVRDEEIELVNATSSLTKSMSDVENIDLRLQYSQLHYENEVEKLDMDRHLGKKSKFRSSALGKDRHLVTCVERLNILTKLLEKTLPAPIIKDTKDHDTLLLMIDHLSSIKGQQYSMSVNIQVLKNIIEHLGQNKYWTWTFVADEYVKRTKINQENTNEFQDALKKAYSNATIKEILKRYHTNQYFHSSAPLPSPSPSLSNFLSNMTRRESNCPSNWGVKLHQHNGPVYEHWYYISPFLFSLAGMYQIMYLNELYNNVSPIWCWNIEGYMLILQGK
jgi:hypothetical protein